MIHRVAAGLHSQCNHHPLPPTNAPAIAQQPNNANPAIALAFPMSPPLTLRMCEAAASPQNTQKQRATLRWPFVDQSVLMAQCIMK